MGTTNSNNKLISADHLDELFSVVGVKSTLDRIAVYFYYRCVYIWIYNHNQYEDYYYEDKLQKYTTGLISKFHNPHLLSHRNIRVWWDSIDKNTLYRSIARINIDTFFNTYYSDYLGYANPMVNLNSFYKRNKSNQMAFTDLLILFHYLLLIKEKHEEESVYSLYHRLSEYEKPLIPDYSTFCQMWTELFVIPKISEKFSRYYFNEIADALYRLSMNTTYNKSLIILYSVLYHDYKCSEKADLLVEKLRDGNDPTKIEYAHAVFTYKNYDTSNRQYTKTHEQDLISLYC